MAEQNKRVHNNKKKNNNKGELSFMFMIDIWGIEWVLHRGADGDGKVTRNVRSKRGLEIGGSVRGDRN